MTTQFYQLRCIRRAKEQHLVRAATDRQLHVQRGPGAPSWGRVHRGPWSRKVVIGVSVMWKPPGVGQWSRFSHLAEQRKPSMLSWGSIHSLDFVTLIGCWLPHSASMRRNLDSVHHWLAISFSVSLCPSLTLCFCLSIP